MFNGLVDEVDDSRGVLNENRMLDKGDNSDKVPEIYLEIVRKQIPPSMMVSAKHLIDISGWKMQWYCTEIKKKFYQTTLTDQGNGELVD